MKCSILKVRTVELKDKRVGVRVTGFVPFDLSLVPANVEAWIHQYEGIDISIYDDGLEVNSWGETRCSDNDVYDLTKGSHIAEAKAKLKIHRFMKNFSWKLADYYSNMGEIFMDNFFKYDYCVDHEEQHIKYLDDTTRGELRNSKHSR